MHMLHASICKQKTNQQLTMATYQHINTNYQQLMTTNQHIVMMYQQYKNRASANYEVPYYEDIIYLKGVVT